MLLQEPSQAWHLGPGMPWARPEVPPPHLGIGAQTARMGELLLVSAERSNLLQTADPVDYKCEMFE